MSAALKELLLARAELMSTCREFMQRRGVIEADTPILWPTSIPDPNIESMRLATPTAFSPSARDWYLQTSPEFALKRLISQAQIDLYEIKHVFRDEPLSRQHHPEFLMLEWYRVGFTDTMLMAEVAELLTQLIPHHVGSVQTLTYHEAFALHLSVNPTACALDTLREIAATQCQFTAPQASRETLLDLLMGALIGPQLGHEGICFITEYPIEQAALARAKAHNSKVAARFEAYVKGIELANGFDELTDPLLQRERFLQDNHKRVQLQLKPVPIDEAFLSALHALPACAGVALGLDRVLLLKSGARRISDILPLPFDRA